MKLPVKTPDTPVKKKQSLPTTFLKQIGEGSFYRIYESQDGTAIRIAKKTSHSSVETEILSKVSHPNINKMIRYWSIDGFMHYEMEMCRQGTLKEKIERKKPPCLRKRLKSCLSASNSEEDPSPIPSIRRPSIRPNTLDDPFIDENTDAQRNLDADTTLISGGSVINTSSIFTDDEESGDSIENTIISDMKLQKWIITMMYQLSSALTYLHENNIVHMDIKPSNVLIENNSYQLCDFNIAAFGEGCVDLDGDSIYMAPEILKNKYFFVSDVFSLGMIYLEVCNLDKDLPVKGKEYRKLRKNRFKGWRIDHIAKRMLEKQHQKRCTSREVMEHFSRML